jgi:hypothetical protein
LRTRARSVLRAASLLWDRLLRGAEKDTDRGLLAHVEIDDRGFVHGHALYWGPHVSWKLMKAAIQQPLPQPRRGRPSRSRLECYPEIDCKPRAPYYFNEDGKRIVFVPGLGSLDDQEKAEDQAVAESVKYNTKSSGSMAVPLDERSWRLHPCLAAAYEIGTYRMRLWSAARGVLGNLKLETEDVADEADALDDDGTAPHEASDATHDADALVGDGVELGDSPEERGPCEHDACPGCGAVGRFRVAGPIHRVAYMKLRRAARVPWGRHGKVGAFIGRPWYPKQAEGP